MEDRQFNKSIFQQQSTEARTSAFSKTEGNGVESIGLQGPILLVESNPNDVVLEQRFFRRNKILNDLEETHTGEEALHYLTNPKQAPNVLALVDYRLPDMTACDFVAKLRRLPGFHALPVIIMTSLQYDCDKVLKFADRNVACVMKPLRFEEFLTATQRLGTSWLITSQPPSQLAA